MGTDIYLSYDEQDMKKEGYWQEGYIRASIGMVNENYILRQIFPPECWEEEKNNFEYNEDLFGKVMRLGEQYLDAVSKGYQLGSKGEAGVTHGDNIATLLKSIIPEGTTMEMGGIDNIVEAKQWYLSVAQHIAMGVSMTKKGLNPKVIISW